MNSKTYAKLRVALHVRAWEEMSSEVANAMTEMGRPPCEGVGRNFSATRGGDVPEQVALHVRAWV